MDYKYLKIFSLLSLVFIITVITASLHFDLFGEIKIKDEIVSGLAKKKIEKLFYQEKTQKIDSVLQFMAKKYFFNGNVLVAYKGNCIYSETFGYADLVQKEKLKKDDIFQLASVSKQFTAMAVMILKERNLLNYDDSVTKYIPEFPYPQITIRMLLNHTSGLPNYYWLDENHWQGKKSPVNEDILKMLAEYKLNLYFTPGHRWDYSNTGYVVLASIVERISKETFPVFMHNNIFEPLKMTNSFIYSSSIDHVDKDRLSGYYYRGHKYRVIPETVNDGAVGDKGVYSTTEDLFKWDQALYSNALVSKETFNEAISSFKLRNKYEIPYGFGFRIRERNNKKIAYHNGKWNGFRTSIMRYVEDTNTVIVLNHTSSALNNSIVREIQQILDDSLQVDMTHQVVNALLDHDIEYTVKYYVEHSRGKVLKLDTVKISEASQILYDTHNPKNAEKMILFKKMYSKGELDTHFMNDIAFLKAVSIK